MAPLPPELRRDLERAVLLAREIAERGARASLQVLAVDADRAFDTMSQPQKSERTSLRARMRALAATDLAVHGPAAGSPPGFESLIEEVAYEQWHRMLFARFLERNSLLIHPVHGVPVSLEECADVATSEGEADEWMVAAKFAGAMLPGIFQQDDPAVRVRLAANDRGDLERVLRSLPSDLFVADDALGWVYQFWQAKAKDEVNRSGRRAGGRDLASVTQLFTEHYMVRFLLENSVGAWWASRHPESPLPAKWEYLRAGKGGPPAFEGWPRSAAELTVMDPCCGSGHFLVAAAELLRDMRMEEEGLNAAQAAAAVLRDNLFGLELDPRCLQLAAFNLALDSWKAGGHQVLPVPNLACSGIAIRGQREDWHRLTSQDDLMRDALDRLYDLFQDAPQLGSLIDPRSAAEAGLWSVDVDELLAKLDQALRREKENDPTAAVFGAAAAGTAKAAKLLAGTYWLVATNPPFLGQQKMSPVLKAYSRARWPAASQDLATVMLARWRQGINRVGGWAWVLPQNWLFLPRSAGLRRQIFEDARMEVIAHLGEGAFVSSAAAGAFICLAIATERKPSGQLFPYYSCVDSRTPEAKEAGLRLVGPVTVNQAQARTTPGYRLPLADSIAGLPLSDYAITPQGIKTGDDDRYVRKFWETLVGGRWRFMQSTVLDTMAYGGREQVIDWKDAGRGMVRPRIDSPALGRIGLAVSLMRDLPVTIYTGEPFDSNVTPIVPENPAVLLALWVFGSSPRFREAARSLEQGVKVNTGTLGDIPFDLEHWQALAAEQFPAGLPVPHSDDPTQWLFDGNVAGSTAPLHAAVGRLIGFRWPEQRPDSLEQHSSADGMVCIPALPGQPAASERLRALLAAAYSDRWSASTMAELLPPTAPHGASLEQWLRDGFFEQHCKLFHHRPFIWQVWDGRRDGFSALLNYHRLDRSSLEKLAFHYLGLWLERQRDEKNAGLPGADDRLAAAQGLQRKLALILDGEEPHDIFVRWKKDHEQPLGWNPDPDDGVRLNIRPFMTAGVLRWKPNIKWDKDRGKNPDGTDRVNDRHLSLRAKHDARKRVETSS
jgi:hypothetical protein